MKTLDEFKKSVYDKAAAGQQKRRSRRKMLTAALTVLCLVLAAAFAGPWGGVAPGTQNSGASQSGTAQSGPAQSEPGADASGGKTTFPSPTDKITDLMAGIVNENTETFTIDAELFRSSADFYFDLAKRVAKKGENLVFSPASVQFALAMTANGAGGDTLTAMETVLAGGKGIPSLNRYMAAYADKLKGGHLKIANSLWIGNGRIEVYRKFLETNAAYYNAGAFYADFEDDATVDAINAWIERQTDGMISDMLKEIENNQIMFLINAITFDAKWYDNTVINILENRDFSNYDGKTVQTTQFVYRGAHKSLALGGGTGVLMPYKDCDFSFAAILPDKGTDVYDYLASISGADWTAAFQNAKKGDADIYMPEFEIKSSLSLDKPLGALGMGVAFDDGAADFTNMGVSWGNIYISSVNQDAYISVTRLGTKASAATIVAMSAECMPPVIQFNRPFVYAIVDNATGLPVFIGVQANIR